MDDDLPSALLKGLIDYAGLFPPAALPLADALNEYREAADGPFAWMLGPFLCPAGRLGELLVTVAGEGDTPLSVGAIVSSIDDLPFVASWVQGASSVALEQVELPVPDDIGPIREHAARFDPRPTVYLEVRAFHDLAGQLRVLHDAEVLAKVRCGGLTPDAFPSSNDLAAFITASVANRVPFKATAGLHHPFRRYDETVDAWQHGFVNLLAAVQAAVGGAAVDEVAAVLDVDEPQRFRLTAAGGLAWGDDHDDVEPGAVRAILRSYGSCSFAEPTADLVSHGLLTVEGTLAAR